MTALMVTGYIITIRSITPDWLGTIRIRTDPGDNGSEQCSSLPFGDNLSCTGVEPSFRHLTGKERDAESGLDYFGARYYASNLGRFMIPDWSARAEPVPYAKLDDPQSLNLYSYVRNNPTTGIDADGHDCGFVCKARNWLTYGVFGDDLQAKESSQRAALKSRQAERIAAGLQPVLLDSGARTDKGQVILTSNIDLMDRYSVLHTSTDVDLWAAAAALGYGYVYVGASYHGATAQGGKNPAPQDGQAALDKSVQVKGTSPRRIGVDVANGEIVVLDQTTAASGLVMRSFMVTCAIGVSSIIK